jgi:hypothetical protein
MNKKLHFAIALAALALASIILLANIAQGAPLRGLCLAAGLVTLIACAINAPRARLCAVTLSVPEIMTDVLDAFKWELPEVFGPNGFATDFSSETAALNDTITAKIDKVPVTGAYDANNGGWKNATQDVGTLMEDVPVTLNQFRIVMVNVTYLMGLSSKLSLYQRVIKNQGYALSKYMLDSCLGACTPANFSNQAQIALGNVNLDTLDTTLRDAMNGLKMVDTGRFLICNTPWASKLGADDRIKNTQYIGQQNGGRGYRRWNDVGGFGWVREYPDMPANGANVQAFAGERCGVVVAGRRIKDMQNVAEEAGIPKVMDFYELPDELSGIHMTGAAWQEAGTGHVYIGCGILFGVAAGKQGGAAGTITDNGGLLVTTP